MRINFLLVFLLYLTLVFSFSLGSLASSALDFIPVVGNLKSLSEALTGKDIITGEELSETERALFFVGVIPGGNYLKNAKRLKNRQTIFVGGPCPQIAQKAGSRVMAKVSKIVKFVFKTAKTFFKLGKEENKVNKVNEDL